MSMNVRPIRCLVVAVLLAGFCGAAPGVHAQTAPWARPETHAAPPAPPAPPAPSAPPAPPAPPAFSGVPFFDVDPLWAPAVPVPPALLPRVRVDPSFQREVPGEFERARGADPKMRRSRERLYEEARQTIEHGQYEKAI